MFEILFPNNLEELQNIILYAKEKNYKICMIGQGLSQNSQNIPSNDNFITIKLDRMNNIKINPEKHTAIVTGNSTFIDVENETNKYGLTVKVRQASGIFSVLSSISTNVHGWDHKAGCIGTTVNWIRAFDDEGKIQYIDRNHIQFKNCIGSFGMGFLFFEVEIQLTLNVMLQKEVKFFVKVKDALNEFKENFNKADLGLIKIGGSKGFITLLYYPISNVPIISNLKREPYNGIYFDRLSIDISRFFLFIKSKSIVESIKRKLLDNEQNTNGLQLPRNEIMNVKINAIKKKFNGIVSLYKFCLVEYFMQEKYIEDFLSLYYKLYENIFVYNATIRYIPEYHDTCTSYSQTCVFSIVICWDQKLTPIEIEKSKRRNDIILDFLFKINGNFYLAYKNTSNNIKKFYPEFVERIQQKNSLYSNKMIDSLK